MNRSFLKRTVCHVFLLLVSLFSALLFCNPALAQNAAITESNIKAAAVYRFLSPRYVMWPDSLDSGSGTVNICVVGDDPDKSISSMEEKTVMDRPINVVVSPFASGIDIKSCDVLFISKSKSDSLEDILAMISDESGESLPILTISDIDDFVMRGGMVSLLFVDNKLRIEINNKAAKAANIRIKSDLMSLSRKTIN